MTTLLRTTLMQSLCGRIHESALATSRFDFQVSLQLPPEKLTSAVYNNLTTGTLNTPRQGACCGAPCKRLPPRVIGVPGTSHLAPGLALAWTCLLAKENKQSTNEVSGSRRIGVASRAASRDLVRLSLLGLGTISLYVNRGPGSTS